MLLDTDVLLDVALDRQPHADASGELLDRLERGREKAFIAWHSVSNFCYLVAPSHGGPGARDFILDLTRFVAVAETDTRAVRYAAELPMRDFEDALQVAAARACGARHIVTRNVRDFDRAPIPALTPAEALRELFRG
jgi:predicted nucleic acid-binding protein